MIEEIKEPDKKQAIAKKKVLTGATNAMNFMIAKKVFTH